MDKIALTTGVTLAMMAVIVGAFGAHLLKNILEVHQRVETFETAVQYHMFHSLAILVLGIFLKEYSHSLLTASFWFFVAGVFIFSGSLYLLALTNWRWLGAITPLGGVSFISGWLMWIIFLVRNY